MIFGVKISSYVPNSENIVSFESQITSFECPNVLECLSLEEY